MVIIHQNNQNNQNDQMLINIRVRICPSFWYQMALSRVLAHELSVIHKIKRKEDFLLLVFSVTPFKIKIKTVQ